ncbi:hypothetical protein OCK74_03595 [Chitinophagaceae bacterium LB-8]|uniref:Tetratricopeptide repeat protein n=1 Tax=Paraflavisolibacter caeni TaxID=2982496 RepID=A0A9X2XSD5_9BACT|nr:hypothetical protein [Paraflavisolibacter caeni]MCU7548179.1 hypothetical protein [Paraflavisolibacter caeni]
MNEILLEKVKDYFSVNMTPEERLQFEKDLETDEELAKLFDLYQTIENGVDDIEEYTEEEAALRDTLKELHEEYGIHERHHEPEAFIEAHTSTTEVGKVRSINLWKNLAIAAVLISIIALCVIWLVPERKSSQDIANKNETKEQPVSTIPEDTSTLPVNKTDEHKAMQEKSEPQQNKDSIQSIKPSTLTKEEREALYANNFKADKTPARTPDLLKDAMDHYKDQEYRDAIATIDIESIQTSLEDQRTRGIPDEQQRQEENITLFYAHYYKAISHMAENKTSQAIPELRNALKRSPDQFWQGKTRWYMALANLKTGKVKEATALLKQVAHSSQAREYRLKALKLINDLPVQ